MDTMTRTDAREAVKIRVRCDRYLDKARNGGYCCPFCKSGRGEHGTGALKYYQETNTWFCHGCGKGGDVIALYQQVYGCDHNTALEELARECGIAINNQAPEHKEPVHPKKQEQEKPEPDYTAYYKECNSRLALPDSCPEAYSYLQKRGISLDVAMKYFIGYDPEADPAGAPGVMQDEKVYKAHPCKRLIIPVSKSYYVPRSIDPERDGGFKAPNPKGSVPAVFNLQALYRADVVFVVEGVFDALAIIEAGADAVALNSCGNWKKITAALEKKKTDAVLVLSLDNDEPGQSASGKLAERLAELGISYLSANVSGEEHDPNDAICKNRGLFIEAVARIRRDARSIMAGKADAEPVSVQENNAPAGPALPQTALDYIRSGAWNEQAKVFATYKDRKTGYANLDKLIGFAPGVYLLNSGTSMGKTTFCVQMADQLAKNGEAVLYYAFEQSAFDLTAKSITREAVAYNTEVQNEPRYNALSIRQGYRDRVVEAGIERYAKYAGNIRYINCAFGWTIDMVVTSIDVFCKTTGLAPVVFIDYLQVIKPNDDRISDIKSIDYSVQAIRKLQMDSQAAGRPVTFVVVSSVSRDNYTKESDLSSGKGSGGLEFTADVVWGMQPRIMITPKYRRAKEQAKRNMIKKAKNPGRGEPRLIMIECTKNRFGASDYAVGFQYYPARETFVPDEGFDAWLSDVRKQEAKIAQLAEKKLEAEELKDIASIDNDGFLDMKKTAKRAAEAALNDFLPVGMNE